MVHTIIYDVFFMVNILQLVHCADSCECLDDRDIGDDMSSMNITRYIADIESGEPHKRWLPNLHCPPVSLQCTRMLL